MGPREPDPRGEQPTPGGFAHGVGSYDAWCIMIP
jgi:hypothetical protein